MMVTLLILTTNCRVVHTYTLCNSKPKVVYQQVPACCYKINPIRCHVARLIPCFICSLLNYPTVILSPFLFLHPSSLPPSLQPSLHSLLLSPSVPPKISGRTGPYTILEGSSRTLIYQVTGDPFPHSLLWFYNGQPFTGNEIITIIRNSSLAIRAASRHDSGNYTFIVTSRYEKQDSISLELLVAGK